MGLWKRVSEKAPGKESVLSENDSSHLLSFFQGPASWDNAFNLFSGFPWLLAYFEWRHLIWEMGWISLHSPDIFTVFMRITSGAQDSKSVAPWNGQYWREEGMWNGAQSEGANSKGFPWPLEVTWTYQAFGSKLRINKKNGILRRQDKTIGSFLKQRVSDLLSNIRSAPVVPILHALKSAVLLFSAVETIPWKFLLTKQCTFK